MKRSEGNGHDELYRLRESVRPFILQLKSFRVIYLLREDDESLKLGLLSSSVKVWVRYRLGR